MSERQSLDEVLAENLRRIRGQKGWSRRVLAETLREVSADDWSEWRIIDLEGSRSGSPPSSARWGEVVALCIALDVPLWDLVLPGKDRLVTVVARPVDMFGVRAGNEYDLDGPALGQLLSGLSADIFLDEGFKERAEQKLRPENLSLEVIAEQQKQLMDHLKALTKTHRLEVKNVDDSKPDVIHDSEDLPKDADDP